MEGRKTRGRQKIEIKRMEDEEARLVTFSKRKAGIIKKASELSNLCGAEVGVLFFSPARKAFSFGNPSMEVITKRFLNRNILMSTVRNRCNTIPEAHQTIRLQNLNDHHNELLLKLEAEKEKSNSLKHIAEALKIGKNVACNDDEPRWWEMSVEQLSLSQLEKGVQDMQRFHASLCKSIVEPM